MKKSLQPIFRQVFKYQITDHKNDQKRGIMLEFVFMKKINYISTYLIWYLVLPTSEILFDGQTKMH